jgi:2',3'-cyclic-nucleotide 2'-phosphodiesterase (5'-nucleotidase family)
MAGAAPAGDLVPELPGGRGFTILAINDVYRIGGVDDGARGGVPRARALRVALEAEYPDLLMMHGGDTIFPSFLSRTYDGKQMIAALNMLDGSSKDFDSRMIAVLGNHEFDKIKLDQADVLADRIAESQFHWLGTNVRFTLGADGRPVVDNPNLVDRRIFESGGIKVGVFGVTTNVKKPEYVEGFDDPVATARRATAALRQAGAEVIVALTHNLVSTDAEILRTLGDDGPDLVIGGHEHTIQENVVNGRPILVSDADAVSATVVRVSVPEGGRPKATWHFVMLRGDHPAPDPDTQALVDEWTARHNHDFCAPLGEPDDCLAEKLTVARTTLVAEETQIRRFETNLGDWVMDRALGIHAKAGAQIAFINAGSLRLNYDIAAGTEVNRRQIEELFAYPSPMALIRIDGRTLQQVVNRAIENWAGGGWWLQISGFAYRHDPEAGTAMDLTLLAPDGPRPIRPDEELLAVVNTYLIDPKGDQNGYTMLGEYMLVDPNGAMPDLKLVTIAALRAAVAGYIAPEVVGRICTTGKPGPCLAVPAAK